MYPFYKILSVNYKNKMDYLLLDVLPLILSAPDLGDKNSSFFYSPRS